ncbi:MAG: M1 family metallopeptidase, partial [Candidatus Glassbacteria bacterium]
MKSVTISISIIIGVYVTILHSHALARDKTYDIRHYDLQIRPDFATKTLDLRTRILICNPELQEEITLGLSDFYDVVKVTSLTSTVKVSRSPGLVNIKLEKPAKEMVLVIKLKGAPGKSNGEDRDVISDSSLFLLWSDRFYPIDFNDWATVKTHIVLPSGFQAVAPGKLVEASHLANRIEYMFETTNPAVCFSVIADARWIKTEREVDGLRMQTLLYPESQKFVGQIFSTSRKILEFYSETYCPYPFDQFSFVTIEGINARRAFPGFVGYDPQYLEKEFLTTGHDAHETALLWWFYTIRGSGPGGFQWTEGFGDYAEFLYDDVYGKPIPEIFRYFREKYLKLPFENDVPYQQLRGNTPQEILHGKYPWLMHILRYVMGDIYFKKAMRLLFERFRFETFSMSEFVQALEEAGGKSLVWWREEWLERKGVPVISLESDIKRGDDSYHTKIILTQLGNIYHLPLEIGIETGEGMRIEKVNLTGRRMKFTF